MKPRLLVLIVQLSAVLFFAACNKTTEINPETKTQPVSVEEMIKEGGNNPDEVLTDDASARSYSNHFVYLESNDAAGNAILMYKQNNYGQLTYVKTVASGGMGLGKGLASQGAIAFDDQRKWLFAVNAGDNTISSFKVGEDGSLTLGNTIASGGVTPVSVTVYGNLLYVVHLGSSSIQGFYISDGGMKKIEHSWHLLSSKNAGPAEIKFLSDGNTLVVTEKVTSKITTFRVDYKGVAGNIVATPSAGITPFGFDVSRFRYLVVSNAAAGAAEEGSCTSYTIDYTGHAIDVNGKVNNKQTSPCWVAVSYYGRYAYAANTSSNTISTYYVSPYGKLYVVRAASGKTGMAPADIVVSTNNRFVYDIDGGSHTISAFQRGYFGTLDKIGTTKNIPLYAAGLAAK